MGRGRVAGSCFGLHLLIACDSAFEGENGRHRQIGVNRIEIEIGFGSSCSVVGSLRLVALVASRRLCIFIL